MASRYWVGGTASWDGTAGSKWALTTGGAGGQSVPTSSDDVFFDANSTGTCTVSGTRTCNSLNMTSNAGTFAGVSSLTIAGKDGSNNSLICGGTVTYTGIITFSDTSGTTNKITTNGKSPGELTFDGVGGVWQLQDALTLGSARTLTLNNGTLDINSKALSVGYFVGTGSAARTISNPGTTWTITGDGGVSINFSDTTNLTVTWPTTIDINNASASSGSWAVSSTGSGTARVTGTVKRSAGSGALTVSGKFGAIDFTGYTGTTITGSPSVTGNVTLVSSLTSATTATFTFAGTSGTQNLTMGGTATAASLTVNGAGGTCQLQDTFTTTGTVTLTAGTLDINSKAFSIGAFSSSGASTRTFSNSPSTWTITGTGTVFDTGTTTNFTATWPTTIDHNNSSATACTWSGPSATGGTAAFTSATTFKRSVGSGSLLISATSFFGTVDFTGYTGTTITGGLTANGSVTLVSSLTTSTTLALTLSNTSGTAIITSNGCSIASSLTVNGAGGTTQLADAFHTDVNKLITITNGTLNTNAQTVTAGFLVSNAANTRTVTLTNSTINITGTSGTVWNVSTAGTLTLTTSGSTINVNGGTANTALTMTMGALTYATVNITAAGLITLGGAATYSALSYTSTSDKRDNLILSSNFTIANNGTLSITGNSVVNRAFVSSSTLGTTRTITISGTTVPTLTNFDPQDITASGNTPWTGTSLGDALGNTGFTFDPSVTLTYLGGTHNWSDGASAWSGTTNRTPLPQDDVIVNTTSAGTLTADMPRAGRNINCTGYTQTFKCGTQGDFAFYGNLTWGAGMTAAASPAFSYSFFGRGAQTWTTNGKDHTAGGGVIIKAFGGSYTLQDAATITTSLTLTNGTFNDGGFNSSWTTFSGNSAPSSGATLTISGIFSVSSASGTPFNANSSNLTVNAAGSTIKYTGAISATANLQSTGKTFGNLWWSNPAATGTLIITGSNTFADLKINRTTPRGFRLTAGTTTTIGSYTDESLGTAVLTIDSSSAGNAATLSKASGTVSTDYLSLKDNAATGGAGFYAGTHSSTVSNVSGWTFTAPPTGGGLFRQNPMNGLGGGGPFFGDPMSRMRAIPRRQAICVRSGSLRRAGSRTRREWGSSSGPRAAASKHGNDRA